MKSQLKAYAKINLSLDVISKRSDGYHDLKSVMQTVSLCDEITLEESDKGGIALTTNIAHLAEGSKNVAYKAADLFFRKTEIAPNLHIHIKKTVPIGAGLGGGSADAATVLRGLNKMYGCPLSKDDIMALGLECGADVPFCIMGGTALAEGLGDILTPLPSLPDCIILIAKPELSISTKTVFEAFDLKSMKTHPHTEGIIDNLNSGNLSEISVRLYNVFEESVRPIYKELDQIKGTMLDSGALGCAMTGTGSAVFGIFISETSAQKAKLTLEQNKIQAFVATPVSDI